MPEATRAADVAAVVRSNAGELLQDLRLFDIYRGVPLGADEKSLAWRLRFGSPERTLTESEVEAAIAGVVAALRAIGARRRA